jgi:ferredoxin-nitrate reductase
VGRILGFADKFAFNYSVEVYVEFVQLTRQRPCDMSGLSHEFLAAQGLTHWPYSQDNNSETKGLYTNLPFHTPDGPAQFGTFYSQVLAEAPDPDYPFVLTTGRLIIWTLAHPNPHR